MIKDSQSKALGYFGFDESCTLSPLLGGHVNSSFLLQTADGRHFTLQRLNTTACGDCEALMHNVLAATKHIAARGVKTLSFLEGADGPLFKADDGSVWRCSSYIEGGEPPEEITEKQAEAIGRVFAELYGALNSLSSDSCIERFGGPFHGLGKYGDALRRAADAVGGSARFAGELLRACERELQQAADLKKPPLRVLHGDPKKANLLFDSPDGEPICFLDFDNVGAGFICDDFGDAARSICLKDGSFSLVHFKAFSRGFLQNAPYLTAEELQSLPSAPRRITLELAMRYLTDALLDGDYFLALSRQQKFSFAAARYNLYLDILQKQQEIDEIIGY